MQLYNKLSKKERLDLINKAGERRLTLSFYKYHQIKNTTIFRNYLFIEWDKLDVLGRIYIAGEGINAQLSVPSNKMIEFKNSIDNVSFLNGVRLNIAIEHDNEAFLKLKVKVRDKIVADGLDSNEYNLDKNGVHVNAEKFNELLDDNDTITIDMRNHYESEIGHFKGAKLPDVDTFRESLPIINKKYDKHKKDKNILMYCTGGIRCEKASAYLMNKGYKNVYQLDGGIIEYARQVKEKNIENKFIGKNFVFDSRMSENVSDEVIAECHQCGTPFDTHTNCANDACHLLFIQCDSCKKIMSNCCSISCKEINDMPLKKQKRLRKGKKAINGIFKKGRTNHILKIIE